jgi:hypothetical protein
MLLSARAAIVLAVTCSISACASDDPTGVVVEVRYGAAYDGMDAMPGDPVADADVRITARPPMTGLPEELATGTADAAGKFEVGAIDAGDASVYASEPGSIGPAGCEWTGSLDVTLRDAGENVVVELDSMVCS